MEENELFGEAHEQEENGLFGRRHEAEQLCNNPHCQDGTVEVIYGEPLRCSNCDK